MRKSTRSISIPIRELEGHVDEHALNLSAIIRDMPDTYENIEQLDEFIQYLKCKHAEYVDLSRTLTNRLLSVGSTEKSREERKRRNNLHFECYETIRELNIIRVNLGAEVISNIDNRSDISSVPVGFSASSLNLAHLTINDGNMPPQEINPVQNQDQFVNLEETLPPPIAFATPSSLGSSSLSMQTAHPHSTVPDYGHMDTHAYQKSNSNYSTMLYNQNSCQAQNYPQNYDENLGQPTYTPFESRKLYHETVQRPPQIDVNASRRHYVSQYESRSHFPETNYFCPRTVKVGSSLPHNVDVKLETQPRLSTLPPPPVPPVAVPSSDNHLRRLELFKPSSQPFGGEPHRFHSWKLLIENEMRDISLSAIDVIKILMANTKDEPLKLIQNHFDAGAAYPERTLENIWRALHNQFGSDLQVASSLLKRIDEFPAVKSMNHGKKVRELLSICHLIQSYMNICRELGIFDLSIGLKKIWTKLPDPLQNRWRTFGNDYESKHFGQTPSLSEFVHFLERQVHEMCNPNYEKTFGSEIDHTHVKKSSNQLKVFQTAAQEISHEDNNRSNTSSKNGNTYQCPIHQSNNHSLSDCRKFKESQYQEKRKMLMEFRRCFRCTGMHLIRDCTSKLFCDKCNGKHSTLMHDDDYRRKVPDKERSLEKTVLISQAPNDNTNSGEELSLCTSLCNDKNLTKNCSKTLLVELTLPSLSNKKLKTYAILDDQSSSSFIDPSVIKFFDAPTTSADYSLVTLQGLKSRIKGNSVEGLFVRGVGETTTYPLPKLLTNESIPDTKTEVATPAIVEAHAHVKKFASKFNELDYHAQVSILIGRDCGHILKVKCYGDKAPFVYQTNLGYALVGNSCQQSDVTCLRSCVVDHEHFASFQTNYINDNCIPKRSLNRDVFDEQCDDEMKAKSAEDRQFLDIMNSGVHINKEGHITVPLPFKDLNPDLPNNREVVWCRTKNTLNRIKKEPEKLQQCLEIMRQNLNCRYVEEVGVNELEPQKGRAWWLPIFPISHPKKNKLRLVFDSSAVYNRTSLNDQLLKGPDETNRLKGVLLRFRKSPIGFMSDIEAMFNQFHITPSDRDFVRFYWFRNNSPTEELIQYRARVHIFGNRPSPAIANFCLKHSTTLPIAEQYPEAKNFILNHIYVDDGLGSAKSPGEAVKTIQDSREIMKNVGMRLHKIASNSPDVLAAFPASDLAPSPVNCDIANTFSALGVHWDTKSDDFKFTFELPEKPFTRRGVLSTINSLYDPLGIASPVILTGRLLQRALLSNRESDPNDTWDSVLPDLLLDDWTNWKDSLRNMKTLSLPRSYAPVAFGEIKHRELHTFADASSQAIAYVMYLKSIDIHDNVCVAFVCSNTKLAPKSSTSIPRLELCAAVSAALATVEILSELHIPVDKVKYYTDSSVTLGYINNRTKSFSKYVARRVSIILKCSSTSQWHYVPTDVNPADIATRPLLSKSLTETPWFCGPLFLKELSDVTFRYNEDNSLPETISTETSLLTDVNKSRPIFADLLQNCSNWNKITRITQNVLLFCRKLKQKVHPMEVKLPRETMNEAHATIVRETQDIHYPELKDQLIKGEYPKDQALLQLSPFLGEDNLIRVGGRLSHAFVPYIEKHPLLIHPKSFAAKRIIQHFHEKNRHQGRLITSAAIRSAGFFIQSCSKMIKKYIATCFTCRRMRAPTETQKMSDLPVDRLSESPPFTYSGLDVCGPFLINNGVTTRKSKSTTKVWALVITCLVSRATHVEPLVGLDITAFKNAYSRFICTRGHCRKLRSDRGSNFIAAKNVDDRFFEDFQRELSHHNTEWVFNPPHASHFGGIWERKIGSLKRILNVTLSQVGPRYLSYDEFVTLLYEAASIINNTPMCDVYNDPNEPQPISPAMLLTQRPEGIPPPLEDYNERDLLAYGKNRYKRVQHLANVFWHRWRAEYLSQLIARKKWLKDKAALNIGDVVLVKSKNVKRNKWPVGRIKDVIVSSDKNVRSVVVNLLDDNGVVRSYERPVVDLVLLCSNKP